MLGRRYDWDMDAIWQSLLGWLDNLPRSIHSGPQLAQSLNALLKQAWMMASLQGEQHIRSVHLLGALTENPHLVSCDGLWPLLTLSQSQLQRLSPLLDAQSDECPETLQDAEPVLPTGDDRPLSGALSVRIRQVYRQVTCRRVRVRWINSPGTSRPVRER